MANRARCDAWVCVSSIRAQRAARRRAMVMRGASDGRDRAYEDALD